MTTVYSIFAALFGLVLGSFMNVLIYRLPRNMSIVSPLSHCPRCKKPVRWYSNIPIASFLVQGGKCSDCGSKISWQYPVVEFVTALLFVLVFLKFGMTILTFKYSIFVFILAASAFTDLFTALSDEFETGIIPNIYTIGGVFIGYIWAFFGDVPPMESFAGSGVGIFCLMIPSFIYFLVRKKEGMGDGDAVLMGMVGSFLGVYAIIFVFTISAVIGVVFGLIAVIVKKNRDLHIPYAPMICSAAIIYMFIG